MTPQQIARAVRLYEQGRTFRVIASELGLQHDRSGAVVRRAIADRVKSRPRGPRGRQDVTDAQIIELRDEHQLSWQAIADDTGMSKTGAQIRYRTALGWRRDPQTRRWIAPGKAPTTSATSGRA